MKRCTIEREKRKVYIFKGEKKRRNVFKVWRFRAVVKINRVEEKKMKILLFSLPIRGKMEQRQRDEGYWNVYCISFGIFIFLLLLPRF